MAKLLTHGGVGLHVTCSVSQQPTDALQKEQKKQESGSSLRKHQAMAVWGFRWYAADQE